LTPKCLVQINGRPLLDIWLDWCQREGVTDVLVNISHHVDQVRMFLSEAGATPRVSVVVEGEPQGNAGTVAANREFVAGEREFLVLYADNLTRLRLEPLLETHRGHDGPMTIALFHAPDPSAAGIVTLDSDGLVTDFTEKPASPAGDLANAGVYVARPSIFDEIPSLDPPIDFGHHVLPRLIGRMRGHITRDFLMDVGTPEALCLASAKWKGWK
jgi:mannose-1-phosphate guanylyltransferase